MYRILLFLCDCAARPYAASERLPKVESDKRTKHEYCVDWLDTNWARVEKMRTWLKNTTVVTVGEGFFLQCSNRPTVCYEVSLLAIPLGRDVY